MLSSLSTKLNSGDIDRINALEKEIGHTLLAFSCHEIDPAKLAKDELDKIQKLEKDMGISLIAVN